MHFAKVFTSTRGGLYRGKKGSCLKFLRASSHMKQNVALSILTPISSKFAKKLEGAAPQNELDEGV